MYKFYQDSPEFNWAYQPIVDEHNEDSNKKSAGNKIALNPEWGNFAQSGENVMGQKENKKKNPVNVLPGGISTGNEQHIGWKNKLKGAIDIIQDMSKIPSGAYIDIIKDMSEIASGAYTPDGFRNPRSVPARMAGFLNYMSMRDIDKWEDSNKKRNSVKRKIVEKLKNNSLLSPIAGGYEKMMNAKIIRELAFPFKSRVHTAAAVDIGLGTDDDYNNLSSASERFANRIDKYFVRGDGKDEKMHYLSTLRNSMRHTIWQAMLASRYNPQIAYSAGMAHETRPYADTDKRVFDNESDADMVVDLLNNVIGRRIGANNRHLSTKQIALLALRELRENGLYQYERFNDGLWRVMKVRISDDVYNEMYDIFLKLDNYGQ